jgi:hypothetical protein
MTIALSQARGRGSTVPAADTKPRARASRAYVAASALLAPLVVPAGPGQTALIDAVNLIAIAAFALFVVLPGRQGLRVPLFAPLAVVMVGSLIASGFAPSMSLAALALAQDVYLFCWFVVLVNLMRTREDLLLVRQAWMWAAVLVSLGAIGQYLLHNSVGSLLGSHGLRSRSTMYNPNMLADYLMMSVFVVMSLAADLKRVLFVPALGIIGLALLATKSNGGMIAFLAGLVVWGVFMAATGPTNRRGSYLAGAVLLVSLVGVGVWIGSEYGLGGRVVAALSEHTFAGRMEHSTASRAHIWDQLQVAYAHSPLGIGPGNSSSLTMGIADRERPDSYRSKEAHSDYLAYAIERGPLGLIGLLAFMIGLCGQVGVYWRGARRARGGGTSRRARLWAAAMLAVIASSAVHSLVIEKFHFRHYWVFFALVCASAIVSTARASAPATEAA